MKIFSPIVEFKEEKFGLFKAKDKEGNWYGFLSSISAYFIKDNGKEYVTRYLDKNRELIGKRDDVVKLLNIWNIGEHFTARQICALLISHYEKGGANSLEAFATKYGADQYNIWKYYFNYRTKDVLDCFKDFGTIVDDDNIEKIAVEIGLGYDMEEENTNDIKLSIDVYNIDYRDFKIYSGKIYDLSNDGDIELVRWQISVRVGDFIGDIRNIFGKDVRIVFNEPTKNCFDCCKGDDENFSRLEDLVFEDIRNNYDVVEKSH